MPGVSTNRVRAVEHNFGLFRSMLESHPYNPPNKQILKSAIKMGDDVPHTSTQEGNSAGQIAWVAGQSEQVFSHWSFVWTCCRRSPLLSKSPKMQKLKEILHRRHGMLQPPAIEDEHPTHEDDEAVQDVEVEDDMEEDDMEDDESEEGEEDEEDQEVEVEEGEELKKKPADDPVPVQTLATPKCLADLKFNDSLGVESPTYNGPLHREASRAYKKPAASKPEPPKTVIKKPAAVMKRPAAKPAPDPKMKQNDASSFTEPLEVIDVEDEFDHAIRGMYTRLGPPVRCHSSFDICKADKRLSVQVGKRLVLIFGANKKQLVQLTGGQCGACLQASGDVLLYAARLGHSKAELVDKKIQLLKLLN